MSNIAHSGQEAAVRLPAYATNRELSSQSVHKGIVNGDEALLVAEVVLEALTAKSPRLRYPVGKGVMLSRLPALVASRTL